MRTLRAGWLLILGSFLAGCLHPTQAVMSDVDLYDWHEGAVVEVENGDTTTLRDLSLVIRSNRSFRADSIRLELFIETPDSMQFTETVGFPMHHLHRAATTVYSVYSVYSATAYWAPTLPTAPHDRRAHGSGHLPQALQS